MYTLNFSGRLLVFDRPVVMGILNVTPDSFFAGSRTASVEDAVQRAAVMLDAGAAIIDIGGMSSRPGATVIDQAEEAARVLPVIAALHDRRPEAIISIDTIYAATAASAVAAGASMVNDISAGKLDGDMYATVGRLRVPYCLMHMRGRPETMHKDTIYQEDFLLEIWDFLAAELAVLKNHGIEDIILDPGFGFGKSIDQNFELVRRFGEFTSLDRPLLAGISRKSMIYRTLDIPVAEALNGSTALHMVALQNGANILRVHDVAEAMQVVKLFTKIYQAGDSAPR